MSKIRTVGGQELDALLQIPGPIAVDFYQATCPPCLALEPRLEKVAQRYQALPIYRVDIDRDLAVAKRFGVKSLPTILLLRGGREISRLDGLITEQDLAAAFDGALTRDHARPESRGGEAATPLERVWLVADAGLQALP